MSPAERERRSTRRIAIWLFVLVSSVMVFTSGGHTYSIDEEAYLQSTRGLMHGSLAIETDAGNDKVTTRVPGANGDEVQIGTLGHPALALPLFVAGQAAARLAPVDERDRVIRFFTFTLNSFLTAGTAVALFLLTLRLGARRSHALLLALVFAFGTFAWAHAKTFFSEPAAGLFLTLAVYAAVRGRRGRDDRFALAAGLFLAAGINVRASTGVAVLPVLAYLLWLRAGEGRGRPWLARAGRTAVATALGALPLAILLGASQWARFGSPFDLGYPTLPATTPIYQGLLGLIASPGKGLFFYAPVTLLVLFGVGPAWRRYRAETLLIGSIVVLTLLLLARLDYWTGDSAYGPRYLIPVLPLVIALLAPAMERIRLRRAVVVAGVVGALGPALLGVVVYFNAAYTIQNPQVVQVNAGPLAGPVQRDIVAFVPRWSPLVEHAEALPEALDQAVQRIDGEDDSLDARPVAARPNDLIYWYMVPVQADLWWVWWLPLGLPWPFLLLAPLVLAVAGLSGLRLRRILRETPAPSAPDWGRTFQVLLGRAPAPEELARIQRDGLTHAEVARELVDRPEHRMRAGRDLDIGLLSGSEAAAEIASRGTASPDGVAVVGDDGWVFIAEGTNAFERQFRGEQVPPEEALLRWEQLLDRHAAAAAAQDIGLAALVVPDKLALYGAQFPRPLDPVGPRSVELLRARRPDAFSYPLEALAEQARSADVYMRTDSHVAPPGAVVLYADVMAQWGLDPVPELVDRGTVPSLISGDLGMKYAPQIYERAEIPLPWELDIVESNAEVILELGGHIGVRRVTRNPTAAIDEKVIILGDSYAYVEPVAPGNLGWLLASTFAEVHFLWAPFCWDDAYVREVAPRYVLLEMAERFILAAPRGEVDIRALADETIRRKAGVSPDALRGEDA
jgi:hypothetical protein